MQKLNTFPTFLVIGAQKCGTTWLARMMSQHPEVSVAQKKELHFFDKVYNYNKGLQWYKEQFDVSQDSRAVGEFTPNYFWTSEDEREISEASGTRNIPKLVHDVYPNIKLIVCLRNPVDRAVSAYYHHIRNGRVKPSQSISEVLHYFGIESMGHYDIHLSNWMKYYPLENILFLIYEDDISDEKKNETIKKVFQFIGVNDKFKPSEVFSKYNYRNSHFEMRVRHYPSAITNMLNRILSEKIKTSKFWQITVRKEEKEALRADFEPHNRKLEELIGRKLPW